MKNITLPILVAISLCSGCSLKDATVNVFKTQEVQPWERDILAQDSMQLDPDAMQSYVDDHIYFSKEAATGGKGVGGGGCGCN
jgi:hypothetical protein